MSKILFIMTAADAWTLADGTRHPTGFWAEEAVVPFEAFRAAGHEVVVATPGGVVPPVDEASLGDEAAAHHREVIAAEFQEPIALADVDLADYAAVYVPGGHGPMEDLAVDATSGALLDAALAAGKPLGVVCHGPAALLATSGFAGYTVAAFSNEEETQAGHAAKAKWLLEDRLGAAGLKVVTGTPWAAHVQVDRTLVTGQNPASSAAVATALLSQLEKTA